MRKRRGQAGRIYGRTRISIGTQAGRLYRGGLCYDSDKIYWEVYTRYDAVENVRDWNYEILEEAGIDPGAEGAARQAGEDRYTAELREDMGILDGLFGRICGKRMKRTV